MLEKWAVEAVGKYANKVEPPFSALITMILSEIKAHRD